MADPLPTEGSNYAREKTGIVRFDLVFIIDGPRVHGAAEPYEILDDWKPAKTPFDLPIVDRRASKQTDGDWQLVISVEGAVGDGALDPVLEIDDSSLDAAIELHPDFEALDKKFGPSLKDPETGEFRAWPRKVKDGANSIQNPYWGLSHYLTGNTIVRVTFGLKDFRSELFRNMRKIDNNLLVPTGTGGNVQALLGEGESFLKKSLRGQYRGNVWLFTLEYWKGKWPEDIYGARE